MLNLPDLALRATGPGFALPEVVAYIGPGAGLGGLAIAIALVLGVLFVVVGLVWYPLKRLFKGTTTDATPSSTTTEPE